MAIKKKNKKKKKSILKALQKLNEELWKEVCHLRDGRGCQVRKHFPEIKVAHSDVYQIDHCFTWKDKNLSLDIANGTKVCSYCNLNKSLHNKSVDRAIDEIVKKREGEAKYLEMLTINQSMSPNHNWQSITWQEKKKDELMELRGRYLK